MSQTQREALLAELLDATPDAEAPVEADEVVDFGWDASDYADDPDDDAELADLAGDDGVYYGNEAA